MKHLPVPPPAAPPGDFIQHLLTPRHQKYECCYTGFDAIMAVGLMFGLVLLMRVLIAN